jgi:hypothetical protein
MEDEQHPDELTELHRVELPAVDAAQLTPETALDTLEARALTTGNEVMRRLLGHQWQEVDRQLAAQYGRLPPLGASKCDGGDPLKVATRFGLLSLPRQVLFRHDTQCHVLPGHAVLPEHHGMLITRALQEWACLFPLDLSFETVQRLLGSGWQTR